MAQLQFDEVLRFNRSYINGLGESAPYDLNGVIHLALAALENLREHRVEGDLEQLAESASLEQRAMLIEIGHRLEARLK